MKRSFTLTICWMYDYNIKGEVELNEQSQNILNDILDEYKGDYEGIMEQLETKAPEVFSQIEEFKDDYAWKTYLVETFLECTCEEYFTEIEGSDEEWDDRKFKCEMSVQEQYDYLLERYEYTEVLEDEYAAADNPLIEIVFEEE